MKIENKIEEKDEHSRRLEILNQNSNVALLGVDHWIDYFFSPPWSLPMKKSSNCVQENGETEVKIGRRIKNWKKKREKRKLA